MPHDRCQGLQNPHHDRIFCNRIGLLQTAAGDRGHSQIDHISGSVSLLIEYAESDDFEDGLKGARGGRSRDIVTLYHIQKRRHVD